MKKLLAFITSIFLLVGCSGGQEQESNIDSSSNKESSSTVTYDTKDLSSEDIKMIEFGDSIDSVYDLLGEPLKEWSSEYVYDSLDDAIAREELYLLILKDSSEEAEKYQELIDIGNKTKEINKLKMLQYTYTNNDHDEETALVWISPRTETVVFTSQRSYIDENGETLASESVEPDESSADDDVDIPVQNSSYAIGDTAPFSSNDGGLIDLTVDSVTQHSGDDWYTPEGVFFAKVDFTIKNNGTSPFDVNAHYFEFYDDSGIKSDRIAKDYFSETIQAGKSAKGTVYFDVLSDGSSFEVYFADGSWTGEYQ